jgi:hypothetical protein
VRARTASLFDCVWKQAPANNHNRRCTGKQQQKRCFSTPPTNLDRTSTSYVSDEVLRPSLAPTYLPSWRLPRAGGQWLLLYTNAARFVSNTYNTFIIYLCGMQVRLQNTFAALSNSLAYSAYKALLAASLIAAAGPLLAVVLMWGSTVFVSRARSWYCPLKRPVCVPVGFIPPSRRRRPRRRRCPLPSTQATNGAASSGPCF